MANAKVTLVSNKNQTGCDMIDIVQVSAGQRVCMGQIHIDVFWQHQQSEIWTLLKNRVEVECEIVPIVRSKE
jgi:hypothetical protein